MRNRDGIARWTAVFTSSGNNCEELPRDVRLPYQRLAAWSHEHGVTLDDSPESLSLLDQHLDGWNADPTHHDQVDLANESGAFVGAVIIAHVDAAHWRVWPNGHPVIQLASGKELDVTQMASDRLHESGLSLDAIFASAQAS